MKRFLTFLIVASAFVACDKDNTPWEEDMSVFRQTKTNVSILDAVPDPGTITEPINFFSTMSFWDEWRWIGTNDERAAAIEKPEYADLVKEMTTLALVKTVVNYPINYIFSAWSDYERAMDFCVEQHAVFRELIARENAIDILIGAYVVAGVDQDYFGGFADLNAFQEKWNPEVIEELEALSVFNEKALSYMMLSHYFDFSKSVYFGSLLSAAASKIEEWNTHGWWSNVEPHKLILEKYAPPSPSSKTSE